MNNTGKACLLCSLLIFGLLNLPGLQVLAKDSGGSVVEPCEELPREPELPRDFSQKVSRGRDKLARAVARLEIKAPRETVWNCLTDFQRYPQVFHRMKTCRVVKQEGSHVWVEGDLKPHMFVRKMHNRTVISLANRPNSISWRLIDGNFNTVRGFWKLETTGSGSNCRVTYTLEVDPGPVVPKFLVSVVLKYVQKEIMSSVKSWAEKSVSTPAITYDDVRDGDG